MGQLQRYRNKLKQGERAELRKKKESGEVEIKRIRVRMPSVGNGQNSVKKGKR